MPLQQMQGDLRLPQLTHQTLSWTQREGTQTTQDSVFLRLLQPSPVVQVRPRAPKPRVLQEKQEQVRMRQMPRHPLNQAEAAKARSQLLLSQGSPEVGAEGGRTRESGADRNWRRK